MTELIQDQLRTIFIMAYCGFAAGLIIDVFRFFIRRFIDKNKVVRFVINAFCCLVIAFLIGDFSFYCQNGNLTITGGITFFAGLWLWMKFFCDIIGTGERYEQKRKETTGVREE